MANTRLVCRAREAGVPLRAALRITVILDADRAIAAPRAVSIANPTFAVDAANFPAGPALCGALLRRFDALTVLARATPVLALLRALLLFLLLGVDAREPGEASCCGQRRTEQGTTGLGQGAEQVIELVAVHGKSPGGTRNSTQRSGYFFGAMVADVIVSWNVSLGP
jgi:hypothetical protein